MRLISFSKGIFDNLGVKLIALVVALIIWFNASGQQQVSKPYASTLSFVNLPDTLTVTGRVPDEVEVSVSGTRRELLFMGFRKIDMLVNLARATPGRFTQRLSVSDLILPSGVEPADVRIVSPRLVNLILERLVSKRVNINAVLVNGLTGDLMLNRVPEPSPMWAVVTGPESIVNSLERLATEPIDLSKIKGPIEREVAIDVDESLIVKPERVTVSVSVSPRSERVLANIPPTILVDESRYITSVFPKTVSITLEGPKALLDTLSLRDVSILADLTGKPPGEYTIAPDAIVPPGVQRHTIGVDSLRILIGDEQDPVVENE